MRAISKPIVLCLFVLFGTTSGCQRGPEYARRELSKLGIQWNQEVFLESVEDSDQVVVELFLRAGMNPNVVTAYGWTPLMYAALAGHTGVVKILIGQDAKVNARGEGGFTALTLAAGNGHTETLRILIDAGADVRAKDNDGWTALMYASERGSVEIVRTLLEKGAEINVANNDGETALNLAEKKGHTEIAQMLRSSGATDKAKLFGGSQTPWRQQGTNRLLWANTGSSASYCT